ncbi:MAG: hypothetical protein IIC92_07285 [Chloroflexi bacterium]|nr:hypothetical protein [Chloroflexota bacterium]
MFGLFRKRTDPQIWRSVASQQIGTLSTISEQLERAGIAVGQDFVIGWRSVEPTFRELSTLEAEVKRVRTAFKDIGSPKDSPELETIKNTVDQAFDQLKLAFHWGKYHYKDASGGPGQRAIIETGVFQRAAMVRLINNGTGFAEAAINAAALSQQAAEALGVPLHTS